MSFRLIDDRDELRRLYWKLIEEGCNIPEFINTRIQWNADTFEDMFSSYWWMYKITNNGQLAGFVCVVFFEDTDAELCYWAKEKTSPWFVYKTALTLMPYLVSACKRIKTYNSNKQNRRLITLLGGKPDQNGATLWAEAAAEVPLNHQNLHQ